MVSRFAIAIAAAAAIMALLVVLPRLVSTSSQFRLEYDKTPNPATADGTNESLVINGDGRATLAKGTNSQSFQLSSDQLAELKSMILDTGFMNLKSPALQSNSSAPEHLLRVQTDSGTQLVTWNSYNDKQIGTVPPIVLQLQQTLDEIIAGGQTGSP